MKKILTDEFKLIDAKKVIKTFQKQERKNTRPKLIKKLDKLFSEYIKALTKSKCIKCGKVKKFAGVSHYFSRKYMGTRYSFENCDWACFGCHTIGKESLEHNKGYNEWYYLFMIKKLGLAGFKDLEVKAHAITRFSTNDLELMLNNFKLIFK